MVLNEISSNSGKKAHQKESLKENRQKNNLPDSGSADAQAGVDPHQEQLNDTPNDPTVQPREKPKRYNK